MSERKVRRVLVMIDYGEGETANGEVFDITALTEEMLARATWRGEIGITVQATRETDYSTQPYTQRTKHTISFSGYAGESVYGATHLDDVVNAAMPDGDRVQTIKRRAKRLSDKAEELRRDAMAAKLQQVAAIRHQHPIARFAEPLPQITSSAAQP